MLKKSKYKYDIAVVLPTFNEKDNILIIIERVQKALKGKSFQIVVVDDNSPDMTWEIAQNYAHKFNNIQVVRRVHESGLSSAIIEGFAIADSEYTVVMDADLQHDEKILPRFLDGFKAGNQIIVGSRKTDGGGIAEWSMFRRFVSWVATKMAYFIIRNNVSDPMSGFFGITKDILETSTKKINPRGFKLLLEILAHNPGVKTLEIGYTFRSRVHGESKLSTNVIFDYLIALYSLSIGKIIPLRFLKYAAVGLTGLFLYHLVYYSGGKFTDYPQKFIFYLAIEISILNNFYWNNRWTFKDYRFRGASMIPAGFSFHLVSAIGAIIHYSIIHLFTTNLHAPVYSGEALGMLVSTIWNYRINFQMTWKKKL